MGALVVRLLVIAAGFAPQEANPRVTASLAKDRFDPSELISARVRWANDSTTPLRLHLNPAIPGFAPLIFEDPSGRLQRPYSFFPLASVPPLILDARPGEYLERTVVWSLCFLVPEGGSAGGFRPPEPGEWKVWFAEDSSRPRSNVLTFHVRQDPGLAGVRRHFDEVWHRAFLGSGANDSNVLRFREFVLSGFDAPQKGLMAGWLGLRDLSNGRTESTIIMLRGAFTAMTPGLERARVGRYLASALIGVNRLDEALRVMNQFTIDPMNIDRGEWEAMRARTGRPPSQEAKSADEVVGKVKEALTKATSVAIEATIDYREDESRQGPERRTFTSRFLITSDNKFRCEHVNLPDDRDGSEPIIISTGDRVGHRKSVKDPFKVYMASLKIHSDLTELIFHIGLYGMPYELTSTAQRGADGVSEDLLARLRSRVDLSKFELGAPERKDGRECVVISWSMTPKGEDKPIATIRIWIDKSTWLPVRRELTIDTPGRKGAIVETYASIHLNSKIEPAQFELAEAKK